MKARRSLVHALSPAHFFSLLSTSPSSPFCLLCCAFARHSLGLLPFSAVISASTVPQLLLQWTRPVILCPLDSSLSSHALVSLTRSLTRSLLRARVFTQSFAPVLSTRPWAALLRDCRFRLPLFADCTRFECNKSPGRKKKKKAQNSPHPNKPDTSPPVANLPTCACAPHCIQTPSLDWIGSHARIKSQTHTPYIELHVVRQQLIRRPLIRRPCQRSSSTEVAPSSEPNRQAETLWTPLQACCL